MTGVIATIPRIQFSSSLGVPLARGKLYTYLAGTTKPAKTYQDRALTIENENPVPLDARGECVLWLDPAKSYKFVLKDVRGVHQWTQDNIAGALSSNGERPVLSEMQVAAGGQRLFTLAKVAYPPGIGSLKVYVDGLRVYLPDYEETSSTTVTFAVGLAEDQQVLFDTGSGVNSQSAIDPALIPYLAPFAGAVATNTAAKLGELASAKDLGAAGNGAGDDLAALSKLTASQQGRFSLPDGTYPLSSNWTPPAMDLTMDAGGGVSFAGARADLKNLVPFQAAPLWSQRLTRKTYNSAWLGYKNIFHTAAYTTSTIPHGQAGGASVVAVYGGADAAGTNSAVWGGNFVAYANSPTAVSIGIELNYGVLQAGGKAYGLVIASAGSGGQPNNAIQIQANTAASQPVHGINFTWRELEGCVTGDLIRTSGATDANCARFLRATGIRFTQAEIDMPSFLVGPTPAAPANRLRVDGGDSGVGVTLTATGTDANVAMTYASKGSGIHQFLSNGAEIFRMQATAGVDWLQVSAGTTGATLSVRGASADADVNVTGKGTGGVRLRDGAGNEKVRVNSTGVGFHGAAPSTKPNVTGSRGGNAALASLLNALANYGLITDSTTA